MDGEFHNSGKGYDEGDAAEKPATLDGDYLATEKNHLIRRGNSAVAAAVVVDDVVDVVVVVVVVVAVDVAETFRIEWIRIERV